MLSYSEWALVYDNIGVDDSRCRTVVLGVLIHGGVTTYICYCIVIGIVRHRPTTSAGRISPQGAISFVLCLERNQTDECNLRWCHQSMIIISLRENKK